MVAPLANRAESDMRFLAVLILGGCVPALAVADEKAVEKLPVELRSCVGIDRNTERLACFDRGVAAMLQGSDAAPSAESMFGLVASSSRTGTPREGRDDSVMAVRSKVTAVSASGGGDAIVTLDNGQVWRQISGTAMLLKTGDEVTINRAALGSFQMVVPSGRNAKVKRIR